MTAGGEDAARCDAAFAIVAHPASYFLWLPLAQEVRADGLLRDLLERRISVSTAEPFAVTAQALRLAPGSADLDTPRHALATVGRVVGDHARP